MAFLKRKVSKDNAYALITGSSRGLGRALAEELASQGFHTILVGTTEHIHEVSREIAERYHTQSFGYVADLRNREQILALTSEINEKYPLCVLINNVGVGGTKAFADAYVDYIESIIDLNVHCTALMTHQLLPNLMRQHRSYILNVGSMVAHTPMGYKTVYPASKSFILSFSLGLRAELKHTPVSVSVCSPGAMLTNPDVTARIRKQGIFGKLTLKATEHIARKCVRQMLRGKRLIVFTPITFLLSRLVPNFIKTPVMSRIVWRELEKN